jgi:hypothetical protein
MAAPAVMARIPKRPAFAYPALKSVYSGQWLVFVCHTKSFLSISSNGSLLTDLENGLNGLFSMANISIPSSKPLFVYLQERVGGVDHDRWASG